VLGCGKEKLNTKNRTTSIQQNIKNYKSPRRILFAIGVVKINVRNFIFD
jgi:hypothetical protein